MNIDTLVSIWVPDFNSLHLISRNWVTEFYGNSIFFFNFFRNHYTIFFNFYFYFILLYNTVLVLPSIDMNQPQMYMSSPSWTPLPPPTPYHLPGSSASTSPKHPVSCIKHRLAIHFLHDSIHVSVSFSSKIINRLLFSHPFNL